MDGMRRAFTQEFNAGTTPDAEIPHWTTSVQPPAKLGSTNRIYARLPEIYGVSPIAFDA